jgi:hypothetical protein
MSAEALLVQLARTLSAFYANDPSGPGVHVARIVVDQGEQFHASVKRFTKAYGKGEFVVCSAKAERLEDALWALARVWLAKGGPKNAAQSEAQQALARACVEHGREQELSKATHEQGVR